ncbi:MAG: RodZ domain-containing protein [Candidatus Omnitrophota bacterium]|jgi:transcriptional regulator with XRE-family HTH domain
MTIEELCVKLQQKRNTLGLTLEEVVEKTKLYPSVIRDIESGSLSNISKAYLKGYIKIYASFLDVNVEDALDKININQANISKIPQVKDEKKAEEKPKLKIKPIPPKLKKIIFYLVALVFIVWVVTGMVRFVSKNFAKATKKPAKRIEHKVVKIPALSKKTHNEVNASLTAKRDCFIRAKVDGKVLFEGVLKKGMSESWKGNREIEFKISDGSAVYLEVNGKSLPSLTSSSKSIKSLKVNSSGISVNK